MTIKDIAEKAGVSPAAVSRYFNGGSLGEEKKKRIREVVEENHYVPNQAASMMRTGKSRYIGVIVPKIHSDSLSQIIKGIAEELESLDYNMILGSSEGRQEKEAAYIEIMQQNHMEGIILMGTTMTPHLESAIKTCKVPIVVTGQCFEGVPCVYYDDKNAMYDITKLMLKKRRHIAYVGVTENDQAAGRSRRQGVMRAVEEAGIDPATVPVRMSEFSVEGGASAMKSILEEGVLVDGVVCATDFVAHGVMKALREAGKRIPEDVSVTGVGNLWADALSTPQLTTVRLYFEECGHTAVRVLRDMIAAGEKNYKVSKIMLGYEIIERGSV